MLKNKKGLPFLTALFQLSEVLIENISHTKLNSINIENAC